MAIRGNEKGSSLIVSLMVLCLLTLMGTAALMMSTSGIENHPLCAQVRTGLLFRRCRRRNGPFPCRLPKSVVERRLDHQRFGIKPFKYEVTFIDNLDIGGEYIF